MAAVTRELARYAVESRFEDLPEAVRHEGERAFVNILGCMLGGAKAPGIDRLLAALQEFSGRREATLIGRGQRADILLATLVNAHSQGVNAFNDTHLATVAHPTGPVAAPILALSERQPVTGSEFLHALILGIEIQLRVGNILVTPPAKCPVGVSTQSILGVIGAAVASAKFEIKFRLCSKCGSLGTLVRKGGCRHEDADHHREIQSGERYASRSRRSVRSDPAR